MISGINGMGRPRSLPPHRPGHERSLDRTRVHRIGMDEWKSDSQDGHRVRRWNPMAGQIGALQHHWREIVLVLDGRGFSVRISRGSPGYLC